MIELCENWSHIDYNGKKNTHKLAIFVGISGSGLIDLRIFWNMICKRNDHMLAGTNLPRDLLEPDRYVLSISH